jgi:hypothetical protein
MRSKSLWPEADPPFSDEVKNSGAITPLPNIYLWYDAKLIEYRGNFSFYVYLGAESLFFHLVDLWSALEISPVIVACFCLLRP